MKEFLKKYKDNQLTPEETEALEKKMVEAIVNKEAQDKWQQLLAQENIERTPSVTQAQTARTSTLPRWILGLAASIALLAVVWWSRTDRTSLEGLTDKYLMEQFDAPVVRMGENNTTTEAEQIWAEAKQAYRDKNFNKTISLLERLPEKNTEQNFYLGLSHLFMTPPQLEKALAQLKIVAEKGDGNFKTESEWFLALTFLKMQQPDAARPYLERIAASNGWKSAEAKALLSK